MKKMLMLIMLVVVLMGCNMNTEPTGYSLYDITDNKELVPMLYGEWVSIDSSIANSIIFDESNTIFYHGKKYDVNIRTSFSDIEKDCVIIRELLPQNYCELFKTYEYFILFTILSITENQLVIENLTDSIVTYKKNISN